MGRLLHDVGAVSAKEMHKNQRDSAAAGKVRERGSAQLCEPPPVLYLSGSAWIRLDLPGSVWICLDPSGSATRRTRLYPRPVVALDRGRGGGGVRRGSPLTYSTLAHTSSGLLLLGLGIGREARGAREGRHRRHRDATVPHPSPQRDTVGCARAPRFRAERYRRRRSGRCEREEWGGGWGVGGGVCVGGEGIRT